MSDDIKPIEDIACVCAKVRETSRAVTQFYDDALKHVGIRITQYILLKLIYDNKGISISELAQASGLDRTTITRNLKPLFKADMIGSTSNQDQRIKNLALTEKGETIITTAVPIWQKVQSHLISHIGLEKWHRISADLDNIIALCE